MTREFQPFSFSERGVTGLAIPRLMIPAPSALLAMSAQEFYGREGAPSDEADALLQTTARYFGAWAFVHFLMDAKGHYSTKFDRFLSEVKSTSVQNAWAAAFAGVSSGTLDQDFRDYLDAGRLAISALPYQEVGARQAPQLSVLNTGEKHVLLAKLALASSGPITETEALFLKQVEAAVRSEPPSAEAHYLRGMWAQSLQKYPDAELEFNQAVQLAPRDPRFLRASLNLRILSGGQMSGQELVEFRPEIEKLEALATSSFEIFLVAHFFAATGETDRASILGKKAARLGPVDPFVLCDYAMVLGSWGDLKCAVAAQRLALVFIY
jgi:tetratricopeptide (TPR) repeat protein